MRTLPPRPVRRARTTRVLIIAIAMTVALVGCTGEAPSFDPDGPCTGDGSAPGAYPDLEARIPTSYEDQAPATLDSGRNCSTENLGSLAASGIDEVRFAGGTWNFGGNRAAAIVVFSAPGLTADAVADFYAESARAANRTTVTGESTAVMGGSTVRRLDSMTGERVQTVVAWPSGTRDLVNVVITNDLPDPKIEAAVAALDAR